MILGGERGNRSRSRALEGARQARMQAQEERWAEITAATVHHRSRQEEEQDAHATD